MACLSLKGPAGNLDIFSLYLPTGGQADEEDDSLVALRSGIRKGLNKAIKDKLHALTLVGGDMNYVTSPEDRFSKSSMRWSGAKDSKEQEEWVELVEKVHGLHEIFQPMATHSSGRARSRLDRIYSNHHVADQLNAKLSCACLEWVPHLSHHRPVIFNLLKDSLSNPKVPFLDEKSIKDERWAHRVALRYGDLSQDRADLDACLKLSLLKQAIRETTEALQKEIRKSHGYGTPVDTDDKIGWTMRAVYAHEKGYRNLLLRCIQAYSKLGELVNPYKTLGRGGDFYKLQDWAVTLHKEAALEDHCDLNY